MYILTYHIMGERWLIWIQFHLHKYFTGQISPEAEGGKLFNKTFWLLSRTYLHFLICFDFLISQLRQITDHRRAGESYAYALRRVIVSCFLIQLISIVGCGKPKGEFQKSEKMKIILEI